MNRLFRNAKPTTADYAALAVFAVVYLAAVTLVVAPRAFVASYPTQTTSFSSD